MEVLKNTIGRQHTDYRATRVATVRPEIVKSYKQDGVDMYLGRNGKRYIASVFDKNFNPVPGKIITARKYKGRTPDGRVIH